MHFAEDKMVKCEVVVEFQIVAASEEMPNLL